MDKLFHTLKSGDMIFGVSSYEHHNIKTYIVNKIVDNVCCCEPTLSFTMSAFCIKTHQKPLDRGEILYLFTDVNLAIDKINELNNVLKNRQLMEEQIYNNIL